MAGETSAELTIIVRAQDAASRVIGTIGRTIGRVLLAPLKVVGNAVGGILKQFFSLKTLLVGGGIIAATRSLVSNLATAQDSYKPLFSAETQAKINDTASAFNKLGASLQSIFGDLVVSFKLDEKLNAFSDWLRDNKQGIIDGFREITEGIAKAASVIGGFFSQIDGRGFGGRTPATSEEIERRLKMAEDRAAGRPIPFTTSEQFGPVNQVGSEEQRIIDEYLTIGGKHSLDLVKFTAAQNEMRAQLNETAPIVQKVTAATEEFFTGTAQAVVTVEDLGKAVAELTPIIEGYLTVGEASELVASTITDGFQDLIQGTVSVGQAFGRMVSTILGELGRLLLYRSLLKLLVSVGSSAFGGSAAEGGLGGGTDGAFGGSFESPTGYASGGRVKGRTRARVGENGPEEVILPGGSQVIPSQRSRGSNGGDTFNIYGARDPKATARELAAVRGYSASARRAFA